MSLERYASPQLAGLFDHVTLHNIADVFPVPDSLGLGICRVPISLRSRLNEQAQARAIQAAGCEIRFNLVGESATVMLEMTERPAIAEVYCGPFLLDWHVIQTQPTPVTIPRPARGDLLKAIAAHRDLPFDPDLFRVLLPWRPPVRLHGIEGKIGPARPEQVPPTRCLAYGSSITHGNSGVHASGGYAMRTARKLGVDLINLGFGGGAHCEPEIAEYIAARTDWDFATLELGINMVSWLETAEFSKRVEGFIRTIAEAHPDKWIFCIDMFPFYMDFDPGSERNHAYRAVVRETVAACALPKLVHLDGRHLLHDITGLAADVLHPSPFGMEEIATNLATYIQRTITDEQA